MKTQQSFEFQMFLKGEFNLRNPTYLAMLEVSAIF